jgi:ATP-dependent exoDNAse (exonuclease V) alpha subunit
LVSGIGDVVVTRLNQRALTTGRGWIKNGDDWHVTKIHDDGSLTVTRPGHAREVVLPADYVSDHVELGYATTAHRAQGRSVDTAHAYLTQTTVREPLYVMPTRGRYTNTLYLDTTPAGDADVTHDGVPPLEDPPEVLRRIIQTSGADTSATQVRRSEAAEAWRLPRAWRSVDMAWAPEGVSRGLV